jgi:transcriptional regulator with XRE-family HTH domain
VRGRPELRERRVAANLTQAQLAERAGLSRGLVSAVELGRHLPRIDAALALAAALGTSVEELFGAGAAAPLPPVDAITGLAPAPGSPVRVGFVGSRTVTAAPRSGDEGWDAQDGVAGRGRVQLLAQRGSSLVLAGCEPGLLLLERLLLEKGTRALAIGASSASARAALQAGRLHAAALHFPARARVGPPPDGLRVHLARWRVGLAAPQGSPRGWWTAALEGRTPVIQREPGAAAQDAFERAARTRRRPIPGPRVSGHLPAARCCAATGLPAVTIEPAAAAASVAFHALETHTVELWVPEERASDPGIVVLLDVLSSAAFRSRLEHVGGYDLARSGARVA